MAHFNAESWEKVAEFYDRLNDVLIEKDMTKAELSRLSDVDRSSITKYCKGKVEPKAELLHKIAMALGVSELWLAGYNFPKKRSPSEIRLDDIASATIKMRENEQFMTAVSSLLKVPDDRLEYASTLLKTLHPSD